MLNEEKSSFWKFFLTYFISVAIFILGLGYFYFLQTSSTLLKFEHFSMLEFAKEIKMKQPHKDASDISYIVVKKDIKNFSISNFELIGNTFIKYIPKDNNSTYFKIVKPNSSYINKIKTLKTKVISSQILLLILFALLSWFLAHKAIKPLKRSIELLDNFSKDLIHDLNTPATSIKLNIELLKTSKDINPKILTRLEKSSDQISSLHTNLSTLLNNNALISNKIDVNVVIEDILSTYKILYPNIKVKKDIKNLKLNINENALRQILNNLISNAFKYNKKGGEVSVISTNSSLIIKDTGVGIKDTNKIFQRGYKENINGVGIGLDITKRLCNALKIDIDVKSSTQGTTFTLNFS